MGKSKLVAFFEMDLFLQKESPEGARYDPDKPGGRGAWKTGSFETAQEVGTGRVGT